MDRLRVGILGCGAVAGFHAVRLAALEEVQIVGLVDPNPQSIDRLRQRVSLDGVPAFASPDDLYQSVELDAVVVATPHTLHRPLILGALERGLHVLCEKPLACTPEETREIADAAAASGLTVTVGYQRHFDPGYVYMRELIDRGDLGELRAVSITAGQNWNHWTQTGWRQLPELSGGGMLMDTGSHMVDVLCWLVGTPPLEVHAIVDNRGRPVDIDTTATIAFEGGVQAQLTVLGDAPFTWLESVVVTGTKAALRYENDPQHPWRPGRVSRLSEEAETRPLNLRTGGEDVVTAWISTIRGERENPTPPAAAVKVAELTRAILEAGERARASDAGALPAT